MNCTFPGAAPDPHVADSRPTMFCRTAAEIAPRITSAIFVMKIQFQSPYSLFQMYFVADPVVNRQDPERKLMPKPVHATAWNRCSEA